MEGEQPIQPNFQKSPIPAQPPLQQPPTPVQPPVMPQQPENPQPQLDIHPNPEGESQPELSFQDRLVIQRDELQMKIDSIILHTKPYLLYRWLFYSFFCALLVGRMLIQKRFYAIAYICFIAHISLLIQFVSPKLDPEIYGPDVLPASYEPFKRKLPEFEFWKKITKVILISNICTLFPFLDMPVYAPLLFGYLLIVFIISFHERIMHMIRNHYVPFTVGKPKYKKDDK